MAPFQTYASGGDVIPWKEVVSEYYMRLSVVDKPGTMAQIATVLAEEGIGISSIVQPEGHEGGIGPLILMIHDATTGIIQHATKRISRLKVVKGKPQLIRVEHFH